jgi:hypothetical protein
MGQNPLHVFARAITRQRSVSKQEFWLDKPPRKWQLAHNAPLDVNQFGLAQLSDIDRHG